MTNTGKSRARSHLILSPKRRKHEAETEVFGLFAAAGHKQNCIHANDKAVRELYKESRRAGTGATVHRATDPLCSIEAAHGAFTTPTTPHTFSLVLTAYFVRHRHQRHPHTPSRRRHYRQPRRAAPTSTTASRRAASIRTEARRNHCDSHSDRRSPPCTAYRALI